MDKVNLQTFRLDNNFKNSETSEEDIARVISCSLRHRLRKDPLEQIDSGDRVIKAFCKIFDRNDQTNLSDFELAISE